MVERGLSQPHVCSLLEVDPKTVRRPDRRSDEAVRAVCACSPANGAPSDTRMDMTKVMIEGNNKARSDGISIGEGLASRPAPDPQPVLQSQHFCHSSSSESGLVVHRVWTYPQQSWATAAARATVSRQPNREPPLR